MGNIGGLCNLLDYARENGTKRLLYVSSSEVYGRKGEDKAHVEGEHGYVDILNPRNSYALGKMASETLCASYTEEFGVDTVIVRPGHIYGPTATRADNRVASMWAYQAAVGEPIVMKSAGTQKRSYCYCIDCATAILTVLLKGDSGSAYNISNPDSVITIKQLGETISECAGVTFSMDVPDEAERKAFNPMPDSSLDSTRLQELGWKGMFGIREGVEHTIMLLREERH